MVGVKTQLTRFHEKMVAGESECRWCAEQLCDGGISDRCSIKGGLGFVSIQEIISARYSCDAAEESAEMLERCPQVGGRRGDPAPWGNG